MSSTMDLAWNEADTGGGGTEFPEEIKPTPGKYEITISDGKYFQSKKGEMTLVVTYRLDDGKSWSDVRVLTVNGEPQKGRIAAAKVLLSQLGLEGVAPGQLDEKLNNLIGRRFAVDVVASDAVNPVTGDPYVNTNVIGALQAQAPQQAQAAPTQEPSWDNTPGSTGDSEIPF